MRPVIRNILHFEAELLTNVELPYIIKTTSLISTVGAWNNEIYAGILRVILISYFHWD